MSPSSNTSQPSLLTLPAELLPYITTHLSYPDLLCLRLTHPHFYHSPLLSSDNDAGIRSRVAWLCSYSANTSPLSFLGSSNSSSPLLALPLSLPLWLFSNPVSHSTILPWQAFTSNQGRASVRLRTSAEFLENVQIQHMLRQRLNHTSCVRGKECYIMSGLTCNGPRKGKSRFLTGLRSRLQSCSDRFHDGRYLVTLYGWDILFVSLFSIALGVPCVWVLVETSFWAGWRGLSWIAACSLLTWFVLRGSLLLYSTSKPVRV